MPQPHAYLNLSRITGISRLDDQPQCFWGSHYEEPYDAYIARAYGCLYSVLRGALHSTSLFCPLEQWRACHAIHGDSAVNTRCLLSFDQLGAAHHLDRLLYGAHPRCNPQTKSQ
jgi:hypothetical protein